MKGLTFPALKGMSNIISAFSVQDINDNWYIIIGAKEGTNSSAFYLRHIVEEGKRIIKNFTLKYGSDAGAVYLRETNYVEGSFVGNSY
jgi:hypothetical protein